MPPPVGCRLFCLAAHQPLAGRGGGLRQGPHLPAPGRPGALRCPGGADCPRPLRRPLARSHGFRGGSGTDPDAGRRPPGPRPARPRGTGDPRHRRRRPAHPGEDRGGRLRCLPSPARPHRRRLAPNSLALRNLLMTPDQYCQEKAAESGSSFYYSFLFLPRQRRRAITALYAFCREVDDAVDNCHDVSIARVKLAWWRGEVAALYADKASHPVSRALAAALPHFNLPQEHLLEIIDGMEMDLDQVRYQDFKALHLYCYRVASVIGLL